jgi:signal transduction histidine kinase
MGFLAVLAFTTASSATAQVAEAPRRVVILSGAEVMLPAGQAQDAAIRQGLSEAGLGPLEFYSEGLDAYRFHTEAYEEELVPFLRKKYDAREPSLVFALTDIALDFLMRNRDRLWPNAPVVFTNVDSTYFDGRPRPDWTTGIFDDEDFTATADLARRLQPDARRILVVGGAGERDVNSAKKAAASFGPPRPGLSVEVKSGVPLADFPREFGKLPPGTIVLFTMMFRDSQGRVLVPREAAQALATAASAPVYGAHSTYLGLGLVGGAMFDHEYAGRAAAEMGVRVLKGESPGSIRIRRGSPRLLAVDDRALERFQIPRSRVPEGYEVRFRQRTFWEQYRWRIVAVVVTLLVETALLGALLVERRLRRTAQNENRQRRRELAQAARLATMGQLAASISHEINQPLGAILANAEAGEMLLARTNGQFEEVRQILQDIRRDDQRASDVVQRVRRLAGRQREMEMEPVDPNAVVDTVVRLLRHDARRHGVDIEKDLGRDVPEVRGDEVALQQVLINLALNGMEAMDDLPTDRRRLTVRTRLLGDRISVRVSDSGKGVAEADRPSLFTSFFTTKANGVGLGLAICRSIVEAHGGRIDASNPPEGGAAFEFTLPVWRADADGIPAPSGATRPTA